MICAGAVSKTVFKQPLVSTAHLYTNPFRLAQVGQSSRILAQYGQVNVKSDGMAASEWHAEWSGCIESCPGDGIPCPGRMPQYWGLGFIVPRKNTLCVRKSEALYA